MFLPIRNGIEDVQCKLPDFDVNANLMLIWFYDYEGLMGDTLQKNITETKKIAES